MSSRSDRALLVRKPEKYKRRDIYGVQLRPLTHDTVKADISRLEAIRKSSGDDFLVVLLTHFGSNELPHARKAAGDRWGVAITVPESILSTLVA